MFSADVISSSRAPGVEASSMAYKESEISTDNIVFTQTSITHQDS